ncbi:hypothetical protein [Pseudalkalibacillus berkeleyi]|uniref:Uncharacterized protein n=1 Tax=Pseudalkalibacillus berkeleyi TaxID=1069813 RepID=A0ABS9H1E4_9BACL|nr:hypothetical protein [Pseudalkalibacillus berkeleyi]MCF6138812.1 hypothetical protein [Pseudalkalibacillus berkeleyi]
MTKRKKILIPTIILITTFIILINWFYPYSALSMTKSIPFTPNSIVVEHYKEELTTFKKKYEEQVQSDDDVNVNRTTDRIQYLLQMFEQDWLLKKESTKMTKSKLETIHFEVKEAKQILIELAFKESYDQDSKTLLRTLLESTLYIEENILYIINSDNHSRAESKNLLGNLHMSFVANFDHLTTFYDRYLEHDQNNN